MTLYDPAWKIEGRMRHMQERKVALDYCFGYAADLPHPFQTIMESGSYCVVCGGHSDRRIHDAPWQKPLYGPCKYCAAYPDAECERCGGTRLSFERVGVEEVDPRPLATARRYVRPWMPGSKRGWHKRRRPKARQLSPRATEKLRLRNEYLESAYPGDFMRGSR